MFLNADLIEFCKNRDILVTGHSPFAKVDPVAKTPKFLYDQFTTEIAKRHNKTPFQVVLKYLVIEKSA